MNEPDNQTNDARMNDQQRLTALVDRLQALSGLGEVAYQRMLRDLQVSQARLGYDPEGRLRVAFFDAQSYDIESFQRQNGERFAMHYIRSLLVRDSVELARGFKAICVFVNDSLDRAVVQSLASMGVELIALRCAGYNNVDLEACRERGLSVVRVPSYSPYAVAEHTVALMLMLNRRLHVAYMRIRAGSFKLDGLTGFDMRGKTVGVIGTGQIGRCLIAILLGFGCRVLAYDQRPDPSLTAGGVVEYVALDDLFRQSDIISLHVPLFPSTRHMINAAAIAQMKDGVMLINTSRGALVDTRALTDGLKSGKIGAAGLDVYEEEAGVFFHDLSSRVLTDDVLARLLTFNNVVVTSHQAYLTREALDNIALTTLENLAEYEQGRRGSDLSNALTI